MPPFLRNEIPATQSRLKWALKIKTGPDITDILGLNGPATDLTVGAVSQLLAQSLIEVGSVEGLELQDGKALFERYAFGPDPNQPTQIIPLQVNLRLKLTRVVLKRYTQAEKLFSFYPQNLLQQQMPFVIYLQDPGDPADPATATEHYYFGCWFSDNSLRYDVVSRDDQRLIQNASVVAARKITLDQSAAGSSFAAVASGVFGGVLATGGVQNLIDDLDIT